MGSLSDQLKKYLSETPREQVEKDLFEFECNWYGIDKNDVNAKRKIKRKKRKERWQRKQPKIILGLNAFCASIMFMSLGSCLVRGRWVWSIFSLIWGIVFMHKVINKAKELW